MFSKIFDDTNKGKDMWDKETICELHRELYDLTVLGLYESNRPLLKMIVKILERAYVMGIKMNRKMIDSKCQIIGWEKHYNPQEVKRIRNLRKNLVSELERVRDLR